MASDRRIAVLSSHLRTTTASSSELSDVSISCCAAAGDGVAAAGEEEEEGGGKEKGCVFCMITRGESPAFKLYEDDICLCILDSNPLTYGHSLIIPKCHYPALEATPPPVIAAMCSNVPFLSSAIMKATNCDSFNFLANNGLAAGQVIFHTHFHIIPRKSGDKLWPSKSFRRRPIEWNQETISLVNCVKENLYPPSCGTSTNDGSAVLKDL
ncbi:adenylylsulfatase HINT3 isoform X1 [Typha angustifolia]|uniref:adenylylsulfatase HINT3 isoform X1 n=1 Tax=Typha angustifolia TaxID=59011 RepID=UPI003C2D8071